MHQAVTSSTAAQVIAIDPSVVCDSPRSSKIRASTGKAVTLIAADQPGRSIAGAIWLGLTAAAMFALAYGKADTGRRLGNRVLSTEARITVIDGALAIAVLIGVLLNATLGWWWADPICALVLVFYGVREARHAWHEAHVSSA